jgi:hypothetical protein
MLPRLSAPDSMTRPINPRFQIKSDYVAAALIAIVPIFYFLPALLHGAVLAPADGILQNVPFRVTAAKMIGSGYLPLWNPYIFSGTPFMASAQVGLLFPLNWFYVFFSPIAATNLMVISSYIVAGLGAYLFARRSGASVTGAVVTSLIWQWSGHLIGQISHINIAHTAAMLPWILWSIEYYAAGAARRRGFLIAAFVAIQLFAGHHQTFVYSLLLVSAYALVMAITDVELRKRYLRSLAYVGGGILLAAVQILPTFEFLRNSNRATASYDFFTSFSLPPHFVALFVAPYVMGGGDGRLFRAPYIGPPYYLEFVGYVGILGLMLAIIAFVAKRDARTKFWVVVAPVALLLAFGGYAPFGLYKVIYFVPLLNLFRVPARHLMEVDFALAILAGRGVTALVAMHVDRRAMFRVGVVAAGVFILAQLTVTFLRPAAFHLGREAPISFLRAPELFLPILIAGASAAALWLVVRQRRGAKIFMLAVLAFDLVLWGQSSGWYADSPRRNDEYWRVPEAVEALRSLAPAHGPPHRILTVPHTFDRAVAPVAPSVSQSTDWALWTQPDVYMMHDIENAAGYDGFALKRYSNLAGQMKVWGEVTDPNATLRGNSREIDLLNVRYVVAARKHTSADPTTAENFFARATEKFGDSMFAATELAAPTISRDRPLSFSVPPVIVDRIAVVSNLAWAEQVPDKTVVARVRLKTSDGHRLEVPLRAGVETAEWAYDRPDIRARIRHGRPLIATSYGVSDADGKYEAHTYVTSITLPQELRVTGGDIIVEPLAVSPELALSVVRLSLINSSEGKNYALPRDSVRMPIANDKEKPEIEANLPDSRWKLATRTRYVDIYENLRVMPRAWLASEARVLEEAAILQVIRTGRFADGTSWEPAKTALVESSITSQIGTTTATEALIRHYAPNRIIVSTKSDATSILILSENHYPGWQTYVDGQKAETLRVNYNLRGVPLSAGDHQVEFYYRPKSLIIGLVISVMTIIGLFSWGFVGKKFDSRLSPSALTLTPRTDGGYGPPTEVPPYGKDTGPSATGRDSKQS